mmetsp:Transcript_10292/g.31724  ORF Transcript_10292/g.31724 Transcript_10292/m.31724 type:complete len:246 (-) Transcript_10292:516-1253(-)
MGTCKLAGSTTFPYFWTRTCGWTATRRRTGSTCAATSSRARDRTNASSPRPSAPTRRGGARRPTDARSCPPTSFTPRSRRWSTIRARTKASRRSALTTRASGSSRSRRDSGRSCSSTPHPVRTRSCRPRPVRASPRRAGFTNRRANRQTGTVRTHKKHENEIKRLTQDDRRRRRGGDLGEVAVGRREAEHAEARDDPRNDIRERGLVDDAVDRRAHHGRQKHAGQRGEALRHGLGRQQPRGAELR